MKLYRFLEKSSTIPAFGFETEEKTLQAIRDPFERPVQETGQFFSFKDVQILAPILPTKIIAVGLNYRDHIDEMGHDVPSHPVLFMKPSTAVLDPGDWIRLPVMSEQVDYEAELAVVIGKTGKNIMAEEACEYILGYTCFNDVTARDLQRIDGQWTRAKSFDSFAPLGPHIETALDPHDAAIRCLVNQTVRQQSNTRRLLFPVEHLVAFISRVMTLLPGDVIATGTPSGVGPLQDGDTVEIQVDGIGSLVNPVKTE